MYTDWLTKDSLLKLEAWARDGLSDTQIAKNIGISTVTLYAWKNSYPSFANALKKGKEVVDIEVENALLKRALGYSYVEVTKERVKETDPETGEQILVLRVTKEVTKEVLPDVGAQIFWLKNRKSQSWKNKEEVEVSGQLNNPFDKLSVEELKKLVADEDKQE